MEYIIIIYFFVKINFTMLNKCKLNISKKHKLWGNKNIEEEQ